MPINSDDFRDVLRHFPAGVTIVTVKAGEETHGMTVSAFVSVSPTPQQPPRHHGARRFPGSTAARRVAHPHAPRTAPPEAR
ncbi:MAG: flavin reductase, partial [Chloroflexota bacterium]